MVGGKGDATVGAIRQRVTPASHGEGSDEPTQPAAAVAMRSQILETMKSTKELWAVRFGGTRPSDGLLAVISGGPDECCFL